MTDAVFSFIFWFILTNGRFLGIILLVQNYLIPIKLLSLGFFVNSAQETGTKCLLVQLKTCSLQRLPSVDT